jgi:hypothetical protein
MAEPGIETQTDVVVEVEKPSRLQSFKVNHPRTAKVVGIAAITAATFGAIAVWKNRRQIAQTVEDSAPEDENSDSV